MCCYTVSRHAILQTMLRSLRYGTRVYQLWGGHALSQSFPATGIAHTVSCSSIQTDTMDRSCVGITFVLSIPICQLSCTNFSYLHSTQPN